LMNRLTGKLSPSAPIRYTLIPDASHKNVLESSILTIILTFIIINLVVINNQII